MNYEPNTVKWKPGDLVIHDADAKKYIMLMRVIGYDRQTGDCKTRYITSEMESFRSAPKSTRKIWRNDIRYLHDPARFGIEVK